MSQPTEPITVLGAGSWGTALAVHLARLSVPARLWARDPTLAAAIDRTRENARYLPGIALAPGLRVTGDADLALDGARVVIVAVPSQFVEGVCDAMKSAMPPGAAVVSATKGLEPKHGRRISTLVQERWPGHPIAVLSGPSFAREVALGQPTALVIASTSDDVSLTLQRALSSPVFRLYTNRDVVGVEVAAALKNVIAIATGLADGLELGENARAALITRGLAEIVRLGVVLGAQPTTFLGLAGLGDLVLTCTGSLSRNRALGRQIARGRSLAEVEQATSMIAEGVRTVTAALRLARDAGIAMPICQEVGAVLFEDKPVREALQSLLSREPRPEDETRRDA